ncbi:tetratricopeptide repeat protein [Sphingobacterium sp. SGG-5]|uniref:tetratricopeptide repeat protein n=1 Tax=Sphingobacterium sp. SGG-5 TaxID=2710881 RepID=UPI0013EB6475|nr:tetratricopeptide repeat protein [Sphingobacterium sp. SGG-5]NGM62903.1 tetratricopeptide repeat protein [Sphingobacterium sp. SGG-5]
MTRIAQLQQFLQETPNDPFLHYALTMEYIKLDRNGEALESFEKLVRDYPDYLGTYYHFGKLLEQEGQKDRAAEIYTQGIHLARSKRNMHALGELQGALNLLNGFDDDDDEY